MLPSFARLALRQEDTRAVFTYDKEKNWDEAYPQIQEDACAICLKEFKEKDSLAVLECGHVFHEECIRQWKTTKPTCPVCIQRIDDNDLDRIETPPPLEELFLKAVKDGRLTKVKEMLERGVDVKAEDEDGLTALEWACIDKHTDIALALLEHPDIQVDLALYWASHQGMLEVVKKLIARGVDVNDQAGNGGTALIEACRKQHSDVALALLNVDGIEVDLVDNENHDAIRYASENNMPEVVDRIREIRSRRASDDATPMEVGVGSPDAARCTRQRIRAYAGRLM